MSPRAPQTCLLALYHYSYSQTLLLFHVPRLLQKTTHTIRTLSTTHPLSAKEQYAKAATTLRQERGTLSTFRTRKLANKLIDRGEQFPLSINTEGSWTQMQMVKMGVPRSMRLAVILAMFHGQVNQESPKSRTEWWRKNMGPTNNLSDGTSARMFCVVGLPLLREPDEGWQNFGVYMLECAVHLGDSLAALHLCALENRQARFRGSISQKARDLVTDLAYEGKDWRALAIRAEYLMTFTSRPTKLDEALELAKALINMTEANPNRVDEGPEFIPLIEPWRVLWDIARLKDDTKAKVKAVQIGATQYNDPEACLWFANSKEVKVYSEQWVDLITKAAMGGSNRACYELGIYWLEKKGWYPCPTSLRQRLSRVSLDAENCVGFDWLEVAAVGRSPHLAAELFLGMALVWRENNRSKAGLGYLEAGVDTIEAGPGDPAQKVDAVKKLRSMIQDWSSTEVPQVGQTRLKAVFEDTKAANFLPPPRMP